MLEVQNLHKTFGDLTAVNNLSFSLKPGDVFGFIGPNGAGKTTTIRMLATLLEPTAGNARLNGVDILSDPMEVRRRIGYMPDFFGLYDDTKVWEYLDFFAAAYQIGKKQRPEIIDSVLELTDLTTKRESFVQTLSRGMQQRLCLARCLVHDPTLLLLDEPASGLDPRARAELKELIAELGRMNKIVIVSSHILPELADFCNTIGIIERGALLAFGPVKDIMKQVQPTRVIRIRVLDGVARALELLQAAEHVKSAEPGEDNVIRVQFTGEVEHQADLLEKMVRDGVRVVDFREEEIDLEDVFLRITTGAVH
ncbi:MAG: ABC transporter ATP-binding protein [Armatimonadetes bacterium]|nr:ABC transporter ATP-binding protein [Armatimonadota bacterium]